MNDIEFIRELINVIDQRNNKSVKLTPVFSDGDNPFSKNTEDNQNNRPDPRDVKSPIDDNEIFIPPLQQRIEMLKKMTGVEHKDREYMAHLDGDDPTAS